METAYSILIGTNKISALLHAGTLLLRLQQAEDCPEESWKCNQRPWKHYCEERLGTGLSEVERRSFSRTKHTISSLTCERLSRESWSAVSSGARYEEARLSYNHKRFVRDNREFSGQRNMKGQEWIVQGSCRMVLVEQFQEKSGICGG